MKASGVELLRHLASGIRPDGTSSTAQSPQLDSATFSELLARVRRGEVHSGTPLAVDPRAEVSLSIPQLERLGIIADAAEAAGLTSIVAAIDGIAVRINVADRTIIEGPLHMEGALVRDLDAFVLVPNEDQLFNVETLFAGGTARTTSTGRWIEGLGHIENSSVSQLIERITNR